MRITHGFYMTLVYMCSCVPNAYTVHDAAWVRPPKRRHTQFRPGRRHVRLLGAQENMPLGNVMSSDPRNFTVQGTTCSTRKLLYRQTVHAGRRRGVVGRD